MQAPKQPKKGKNMKHIETAKQMAAQLQEKLNAQQAKIKTYHVSKGGAVLERRAPRQREADSRRHLRG